MQASRQEPPRYICTAQSIVIGGSTRMKFIKTSVDFCGLTMGNQSVYAFFPSFSYEKEENV